MRGSLALFLIVAGCGSAADEVTDLGGRRCLGGTESLQRLELAVELDVRGEAALQPVLTGSLGSLCVRIAPGFARRMLPSR